MFLTVTHVLEVIVKHGITADMPKSGQALLAIGDLDQYRTLSDLEDKLLKAGVIVGDKQFHD